MQAKPQLNFLEALFGLMVTPGETSQILLDSEKPPYTFTLLLCMLLTVFVPIVSQTIKYGITIYDTNSLLSLLLIVVFSFLLFVALQTLLLRLCGSTCELRYIFASACYCIAPILLAIWLIYFFNYLSSGRLSLLHLIMTGQSHLADRFIHVIPIAALISQLMVLVVMFYCLRFICEMYSETALMVTLLSLVPLFLALSLGVLLGEIVRPGTQDIFWKVLFNPAAITIYKL